MTVFTPLVIPAKKMAVDIFSAFDQQLDWLVKTSPKANPDEIVNALAKKAKHAEINGATNHMKVFSENKIGTAEELQKHFQVNGRPDGLQVTEFKGTPYSIKRKALEQEDYDDWTGLLEDTEFRDPGTTELTVENLDNFIYSREELLANEDAIDVVELEDQVNRAHLLREKLTQQPDSLPELRVAWEDFATETSNDIKPELTPNNINEGVEFIENYLANLKDESDGVYTSQISEWEDRLATARDIQARMSNINTDIPPTKGEVLKEYGFAEDAISSGSYSVDDIASILEEKRGYGWGAEFEEAFNSAPYTSYSTESIDLTRTTQEFVDNAGEEFNRIASEIGLQNNYDANNPESVATFFRVARNTYNTIGNKQTELAHLDQLEQSYAALRQHIDAGDETITIPNYNTRQVQGNIRYDFVENAYREHTLPDTDDATYALRGYNDPTVDRKGFNRDVHPWGGLWFSRTDSPIPPAHRIQELQSDVQNQMATARNAAIEQWRKPPVAGDLPLSVVGHKQPLQGGSIRNTDGRPNIYGPNHPTVVKLRGSINNKIAADFKAEVGIDLPVSSNHSIQDIKQEMVDPLWAPNTVMPQKPGDAYSTETTAFLHRLTNTEGTDGARQYLEASTEVVEEIANKTGMTMPQVRDIIDQTKNLNSEYQRILIRERGELVMDAKDAAKYRVTPDERRARIVNGQGVSKEEGELNANAVVETLAEFGSKPYPGAKSQSDITSILVNDALPEDYSLGRLANRYEEQTANGITDPAMVRDIRAATYRGIAYVEQELPELKGLLDKVKAAEKLFDEKITVGMKKLKPLEEFPDAKNYQLDYQWQKQGLQEEIVYAIKNGKTEVWLTGEPEGYDLIGRGNRPHKQYIAPVLNEKTGKMEGGMLYSKFKGLAKKFHAELVEEDGYLKMKLPTGKKLLAVTGGTGVLPIAAMADTDREDMHEELIKAGYSPAEAKTLLDENWDADPDDAAAKQDLINADYTQEEIDFLFNEAFVNELTEDQLAEHPGNLVDTDVPTAEGATPEFYKIPFEQIKEIAIELEVDPTTPSGMDAVYHEMELKKKPELRRQEQEQADLIYLSEVRAGMGIIIEHNDRWQPWNYMAGGLGDGVKQALYEKNKAEIEKGIMETGKKFGYDLRLGDGKTLNGIPMSEDVWYAVINDKPYEATPEWWRSMLFEGGEIGGALIGAKVGSLWADRITKAMGPYGIRFAYANQVAGVMIGGTIGGMAGDQYDYMSNLMRAHEKYNWSVAKDKAMGSAQLTIFGEVGGAAVLKLGGASWGIVTRAYNRVAEGNINGAYEMLKKITNLSDAQIDEIIAGWEKLAGRSAPTGDYAWYNPKSWGTGARIAARQQKEKAIAIIPTTNRGGERIISGVANKNPGAGAAIANEADSRAKSLWDASAENVGKDGRRGAGDTILKSVEEWQADVNFNLSMQKQRGFDLAPDKYGYRFKKDYINLMYDNSVDSLEALKIAEKLEEVELQSSDRTFADFLAMKDIVDKLARKKGNTKIAKDYVQKVVDAMDDEIESVSQRMGPEGKQWLIDYKAAKKDEYEMFQLNKSGLIKSLTKDESDAFFSRALSDTNLAKTLIKYGDSLDGSYNEVIKNLPLKAQPKVEALVMDELIQKFTVGTKEGFQAIKFPELARELNKFDFIWPAADSMKSIVNAFSEVYKNDVRLSANAQGSLVEDAFTSYLTTDPLVRAHYAFASAIFNRLAQLTGTSRGDASALVRMTTNLLENPLSPNNVKHALDVARGDAALTGAINRYTAQAAADRHAGKPGTPMHAIFHDGKGGLTLKDSGKIAEEIPEHRIVNEDTANTIIRDSKTVTFLSTMDKARLINRGFIAVGLNDGTVIKLN